MAKVGDYMSHPVLALDASASVGEAASLMAQRHVGSVLVTREGALAGIFTERDIVRAVSHDVRAGEEPLAGWYTADPQTVTPEVPVAEARRTMLAGHFRHLPVTDRAGGEVIGMLSMRDLARAAAEQQAEASV